MLDRNALPHNVEITVHALLAVATPRTCVWQIVEGKYKVYTRYIMFTSCIYIFLRLASKYLNCTRSPDEMVQKLQKYD